MMLVERPIAVCAALQLSLPSFSFTLVYEMVCVSLCSTAARHCSQQQLCTVCQDSASAGASYGQREYWEDRYFRELRASTSQYEWYVGYEALRTILRWHIPLHAAVLQVRLAQALSPSKHASLRC